MKIWQTQDNMEKDNRWENKGWNQDLAGESWRPGMESSMVEVFCSGPTCPKGLKEISKDTVYLISLLKITCKSW